jgi:hydrogenase maturation protein HypF
MIANRVNTVQTSSCGRLFDAVTSLIGLRQAVNFEGQAAIELETIAEDCGERYPYWNRWRQSVASGLPAGHREHRARSFQGRGARQDGREGSQYSGRRDRRSLPPDRGGKQAAARLSERRDVSKCPGVTSLRASGFEVFLHAQVPPNDGGIALGQAAIAAQSRE